MSPEQGARSAGLQGVGWPGMGWAWWGLAGLVVASVFATIDAQIILLVTEPLRKDLGLSDPQIGALNGVALSLVAVLATIPLGWLADRMDRRLLLTVCVMVWAVCTAGCGFAQNYSQIFLWCVGISFGEAVLGPITYSIIPDLFPPARRVLANYVFYVAAAIFGAAGGLLLSGLSINVIETYRSQISFIPAGFDSWRVAMIAVALPGPLVALMIATMRLKGRDLARRDPAGERILPYARREWRTLVGVFGGFGLSFAATGGIGVWGAVFLVRTLGESPGDTGVRLGLVAIATTIVGVVASGLAYRHLLPRLGSRAAIRLAQLGTGAALLLTPLLLFVKTPLQYYVLFGASHVATTIAMSLSPTVLQDIAPPLLRGRVVALGGVISVVFRSITPWLVGVASERLNQGLALAIVAVVGPAYLLAILLQRFGEHAAPGTVERVAALGPD